MSSETEVTDVQDQNYYYLLALLMSLPFHHLISAQEIYSSLSVKQSNSPINIPSIYEYPNERLELFRNAVSSSVKRASSQSERQKSERQSEELSFLLDRFIQFGFIDTAPNGEKFEFDWQAIFNDELQGCAEIYRAEMMIFKRMLYEQEENLKSPLKLTNENFSKYLDHELFDSLTGNETEKLLINSLSAKYQMSVTILDKKLNEIISDGRKPNLVTNKKRKSEVIFNSKDNLSILMSRLHGWESCPINELMIYELKTGAYWSKWRQAAKLAKFDFDLLESLDALSIRFYELTKFLRLASYNQTERTLSRKFEMNYDLLTSLVPLQKLQKENEIRDQIRKIVEPLKKRGYIKSYFLKNQDINKKVSVCIRFY